MYERKESTAAEAHVSEDDAWNNFAELAKRNQREEGHYQEKLIADSAEDWSDYDSRQYKKSKEDETLKGIAKATLEASYTADENLTHLTTVEPLEPIFPRLGAVEVPADTQDSAREIHVSSAN